MDSIIWNDLEVAFGRHKRFWMKKERKNNPNTTDRLLHYIIMYYSDASKARKAVRIFNGVEGNLFGGWNEVRIATVGQIEKSLIEAGIKSNTWELAITLKDFLQNAWDTLFTCDLTKVPQDLDSLEISKYLKQLRGVSGAWASGASSPFRPGHSSYDRKSHRKENEAVLFDVSISYLKYLWKQTKAAPFGPYSDRVLTRIGVFDKDDTAFTKRKKYNKALSIDSPIKKHKHLINLAKIICTSKNPRCNMCPISKHCDFSD